MIELTELGQLLLGAFALQDTHTLSATEIHQLAGGAISAADVQAGLSELVEAGFAEDQRDGGHRLTKNGISESLKLQEALSRRSR